MNEDPDLICRDRHVTVRQAPAFLDIFPETIEVCTGQTVTISIKPPVDPKSARTEPASGNAEADWLRSESQDGESIVIKIPKSATRDTTYKYNITIDGVGMLDPRFRIIR